MMKFSLPVLALGVACCATIFASNCVAQTSAPGQSALVYPGQDGRLKYKPYTENGDTIPDFSHAGYGGGGVALPLVPAKVTLSPDAANRDDHARIQAAIAEVAALPPGSDGFRGAVLLRRGQYRVSDTLHINASGIVVRGEGSGEDGTVITATGTKNYNLFDIGGETGITITPGSGLKVVDTIVPVGARRFSVAAGHGLKTGDTIIVRRKGNAAWISAIGMDRIKQRPVQPGREPVPTNQWKPFDLDSDRVVVAVDGGQITIDAPLTCAIETQWGGGEVRRYSDPGRIERVGVEDLRAVSLYDASKRASQGTVSYFSDEEHANYLVTFNNIKNAWARRVITVHFAHGVAEIGRGSKWVTVEDASSLDPVSMLQGSRRYPFHILGQLNLVQRCFSSGARHAYAVSSRVAGPNVFLDCKSEKDFANSEPHHRWSTGGLYDNISAPIAIHDRHWFGSGHGWAGANYVVWNSTGELILQSPPTARNFGIGFVGEKGKPPFEAPDGHWESFGVHVNPRSLYLKQLEDRLGPQAVADISALTATN